MPSGQGYWFVASDGGDRALDVNGRIATSIQSIQTWLAAESGGTRLRVDTFQGQPDIGFVRAAHTDAEIAAAGTYVHGQVQEEVHAAGFDAPNKIYAVYYEGSSTYACADGAWPPTLLGNTAVFYLQGLPTSAVPCSTYQPGLSATNPAYPDLAILHEILHTLGAVPTCAPHQWFGGHVSDSRHDLMWSGPAFPESPQHLDIGRDDYWGHGRGDCLDLSLSAFLDPLPSGAQPPPGWPR